MDATPPLLLLISREDIEIWIFGDIFVELLNPNPKESDWNQNIGGWSRVRTVACDLITKFGTTLFPDTIDNTNPTK